MVKIKAVGKYAGWETEILCGKTHKGLVFFFNKHLNPAMESVFRGILHQRHPIAGSFSPEENSMINVLNVCRFHFFDSTPAISIEGDIGELPHEPDVIY